MFSRNLGKPVRLLFVLVGLCLVAAPLVLGATGWRLIGPLLVGAIVCVEGFAGY